MTIGGKSTPDLFVNGLVIFLILLILNKPIFFFALCR